MSRQHPDLRAQTIVDSTSGKAYYVLIKLLEDKTDFEESSIDVRITDGTSCWEIEGKYYCIVDEPYVALIHLPAWWLLNIA